MYYTNIRVCSEETPFVMPRAQNVTSQPADLIDGHATLIAAHTIRSTPMSDPERLSSSSGNREDENEDSALNKGYMDSKCIPIMFRAHSSQRAR